MKLDKKLVDDLIISTKKYYSLNGDAQGLNEAMREMHLAREAMREMHLARETIQNTHHYYEVWRVTNLIEDLAKFARKIDTIPYGDIYNALEIFGIIVEDVEK